MITSPFTTDQQAWERFSPEQKAVARRYVRAELSGFENPLSVGGVRSPSRKRSQTGPSRWLYAATVVTFVIGLGLGAAGRGSQGAAQPSRAAGPVIAATSAPQVAAAQKAVITDTAPDTPAMAADHPGNLSDGLDYLTMKAQAEEQLKAKLTDDHGLRYRDVHTKLSTLEGGGTVAFCGEVNSRTPVSGYGGWERFLASRSVAATESTMPADDFAQAWSRFCTNGVEGPRVWF